MLRVINQQLLFTSFDKSTLNDNIENEDITLPSYLEECQIENSKQDREADNSWFEQGNDYKPLVKEILANKPQTASTERHVKKRKKTKSKFSTSFLDSRKLDKIGKLSMKGQEANRILRHEINLFWSRDCS